jgi:hypothetical protein
MLIVDPKGNTKLDIFSEIPNFSLAHFIVTGRVPELLEVVKATI